MKNLTLVLIFTLLACSYEVNKPRVWIKPDSITITCEEYYSHSTAKGVLANNVWNKNAAKGDEWSQCLEKRLVEGEPEIGWSWSWPFGRKVIYSQPQIKIGASPWAPEPKFDNSFPLKISDLQSLDISHHLEIDTNGDLNTATTMWLLTEPYRGSTPNKSVIAVEIMIWTYSTPGHLNPAGKKVSEVTFDDMTWEVWYKKDWEDKSGVNDNRWAYIAFRAKESTLKANIPGLELLNYAIQEKLISEGLYIADIELGNEIMSGAGITWVKEFNVHYEVKL